MELLNVACQHALQSNPTLIKLLILKWQPSDIFGHQTTKVAVFISANPCFRKSEHQVKYLKIFFLLSCNILFFLQELIRLYGTDPDFHMRNKLRNISLYIISMTANPSSLYTFHMFGFGRQIYSIFLNFGILSEFNYQIDETKCVQLTQTDAF
jgi:hypothetical protein